VTLAGQAPANGAIAVTYRSTLRSGREWTAIIDLGDATANSRLALDIAWKHRASIVASVPA
jgi:hypothetical protein